MTIQKRKEFTEGRDYWYEYVRINGYAFEPTDIGLKKLSRELDISVSHLRRRINTFLEA